MLIEGKFYGIAVLVGKSDSNHLRPTDSIKGFGRKFCKELIGIFEGGFVIVKGDGVAGGSLPDGGFDIVYIAVANQQNHGLHFISCKAVILQGEIGSGYFAVLICISFEINITIGGQAVGAAVICHIGIAVAEAASQYQ